MKGIVRQFVRLVHVDYHTMWIMALRIWNIFAGLCLLWIVPLALNREQQGYYYTFMSIAGLQAIFDLGLSQILVQIVSHEFGVLDHVGENGDPANQHIQKLRFVRFFSQRWYLWAAGLFLLIVAPSGAIYFSHFGQMPALYWIFPWFLLIAFTAGNLFLSPQLAFVEGAGWPGAVASARLAQSVIGYLLMFALLALGASLWAVPAVPAVAAIYSAIWLRRARLARSVRFVGVGNGEGEGAAAWRREIFGLQWRVALSWVGGYFASQFFTPLLFANQGAEIAGQWGMAMVACTAIQFLAMSWVNARAPLFGSLIARGERDELRRTFRTNTLMSVLFCVILSAGFIATTAVADQLGLKITNRLLDIPDLICLAGVVTLNTFIYAMGIFMRAHKEEPLVISSVVIGSVTLVAALIGSRISVHLTALLYLCVTLFLNLPWAYVIFRSYYDRK